MSPKERDKKSVRRRRKPREPRVLPSPNAFAFTISGVQAMGGPGRTSVYDLAKKGVFSLFKDELGRTLVTGDSVRKFLGITTG
jgi:hypothetical protein